jgi:glyoxylase-like metal-dependent hydrolase (beta-lactamase superfamily II)
MGFVKEWTNAKFIIQKDEYEHAMNPIPPYRHLFLPEKMRELQSHPAGVEIVDGDAEIVEGVKVLKCPGHTPGMQAVSIESSEGMIVFGSDLVNIYHNIYPMDEELGTPYESTYFIPPGFYTNMVECFTSIDRIRAIANIIVPGHEPRVAMAGKIPPSPYVPIE